MMVAADALTDAGSVLELSHDTAAAGRLGVLPPYPTPNHRLKGSGHVPSEAKGIRALDFHTLLDMTREAHVSEMRLHESEIHRLRAHIGRLQSGGAANEGHAISVATSEEFTHSGQASLSQFESHDRLNPTISVSASQAMGSARPLRGSAARGGEESMTSSAFAPTRSQGLELKVLEGVLGRAERDRTTILDHEKQMYEQAHGGAKNCYRRSGSQETLSKRPKALQPRKLSKASGFSKVSGASSPNSPQSPRGGSCSPRPLPSKPTSPANATAAAATTGNTAASSPRANGQESEDVMAPKGTDKDAWGLLNAASRKSVAFFENSRTGRNEGSVHNGIPFSEKVISDGHNEKQTVYKRFSRWVASPSFEATFAGIIMCNSFFMALEAQYNGWDVGFDLGYPNSVESADVFPFAQGMFDVVNFIFGLIFLFEVVAKLTAYHCKFLTDLWNYFDAILVTFWIMEVASTSGSVAVLSPSVLRVFRLMKVLRLLRLVRSIQGFDSLYIMTSALTGSVTVLAWSAAMMCLVQMMLALLYNQVLVETYLTKDSNPIHEKVEVYEYFGTFSRALLSLFEMTLANWPPVCRVLVENVSEAYLIPALIHKLTIGFAVVGVINGVFMQETFKVAATDDRIMVRQKQMAMTTHVRKMRALFERADDSGDGLLDIDEFRGVVSDPGIKTWLASMDLDASDADTLFHIIDDDMNGHLTVDELIRGVSRLKGPARSIDMAMQMRDHQALQAVVLELRAQSQGLEKSLRDLSVREVHHFQQLSSLLQKQDTLSETTNMTIPYNVVPPRIEVTRVASETLSACLPTELNLQQPKAQADLKDSELVTINV